ncbi:hypothetical protein A2311_00535 [candidate division WOR-1 bacterium RIFOXYB2_FULL_48_7]|uniref:Glycosyltransferase 2-like domain-containing protein n=1 Tax=candidate division WOR-1 bacterium RIFOXYB2_FULL_48_7 TaxID=1802583 RepID=A0A1F4TTW7_UNCSA|nr:MAG: hypothetical protein A2311_00535 [candidate division WOR-1 bacterium RIFOXYB2_FULL_48_7]
MIDLSIIIVNYNGEKYLPGCLDSLPKNPTKLNIEVIMVDNHSADNSVNLVKDNYPAVRIIELPENRGFCAGNNAGLKVYQGRYALLLNNDTIVKAGALEKMVAFLDTHPKIGVLGPKLLNTDGTPQHQGGLLAKKFWLSPVPVAVDYVLGAALLIRRQVIDIVGGLDEHYFFSNDDLDYCRMVRRAGWQVFFLPEAEIIHHGGYTIKKFNQKLFVEGFKGGLYFARKHYGFLIYWLYRLLLIIGLILAVIGSAIFYPFLKHKEVFRAYIQILHYALTA